MRLLQSSASPFSAKVRLAARHCGVDLELVATATGEEPELLMTNNPLGKIPVLLTDEGLGLYDSAVITDYLDTVGEKRLFPADAAGRARVKILEALADGIAEAVVLIVYEKRNRPPEMQYQAAIDKQRDRAWRGLAALEAAPPAQDSELTAGDFAIAAVLSYLELRLPEWRADFPSLAAFHDRFAARFAAFDELKSRAA
ncbi:glutathione S-transferase N-terminal domain-containing protein [Aurantimonas sp. MSK8Z-1]|uniref:glutathione S-transferase family protein n=1 Tax=Mangrovibrevibacter kandeliae TaxID=2968473 RepID=UPI00211971DA|nr:glutathione S-transferase N-terminal domain-containing protein [Aurantimonas sp. MSK8Z-1]MCW4114177.1 glutathione S-transferase N-terminal domain-containing protein [Aurantimonas sp. MSK8Z-1]